MKDYKTDISWTKEQCQQKIEQTQNRINMMNMEINALQKEMNSLRKRKFSLAGKISKAQSYINIIKKQLEDMSWQEL